MKHELLVPVLIVALMAAVLVLAVGCGGSSSPQIKYDARFMTAASSPNPPKVALGMVTPSGAGGEGYQAFVRSGQVVIKRLSDGREGFGQTTVTGTVLAMASRLNTPANRFDIVTIESDGNIYDYNGGPGVLVAAAAGCKYVAIEGLKAIGSTNGTKVDLEQWLPGAG